MKHWQGPVWSAQILEQVAEDTLAKTRVYNADADVWRLLRPEDLATATTPSGGVVEKEYYLSVTVPPAVATVVISFVVPSGIGITFYGVNVVSDLGPGAVYEIDVNRVKRQEIWLNMFGVPPKGGTWTSRSVIGVTENIHPVWAVVLEQLVFTRQNDLVQIRFYCKHGFTGQIEFWPLAINRLKASGVAGNRKGLALPD